MSAPATTTGTGRSATSRPATASLWLLTSVMTRAAQGRLRLALSVAAALALGGLGLLLRVQADAGGVSEDLVATLVALCVPSIRHLRRVGTAPTAPEPAAL